MRFTEFGPKQSIPYRVRRTTGASATQTETPGPTDHLVIAQARRQSVTEQFSRDQAVVEYVKKAAEGRCDLCGEQAPFSDKENQPYLECHHVKRLADGGDDAISNAVALCANCHRRMHVLDKDSDRRALFNRIQERD